jgi:hypothetical protein
MMAATFTLLDSVEFEDIVAECEEEESEDELCVD